MNQPTNPSKAEEDFATVQTYLQTLQNTLAAALAAADGGVFTEHHWQGTLGGGRGLRLENGAVFERAGVNFSSIGSDKLPPAATVRRPHLAGKPYRAVGVSLVAHPQNPHCPTVHINTRFFMAEDVWWFGGGMDLTPHYAYEEDCRHFHGVCKTALDKCDMSLYPLFKRQCDEYFFIKHRDEMRGIGGTFFDDFNNGDFADSFAVLRAVGDSFCEAYIPIVARRAAMPFGEQEKMWQDHRRGRYVEFNLVYDRGTLFGLQSGGRADAILMSLPPVARWGDSLSVGDAEKALKDFLRPKEWA